jgi:hypothetical protein
MRMAVRQRRRVWPLVARTMEDFILALSLEKVDVSGG